MQKLKFWKYKTGRIIAIISLVAIFLLFRFLIGNNEIEVVPQENFKKVETSTVKEILNSNSNLNLVGRVESESESTIKSESQGEISVVYKKLSDDVFAGEIIAEIENSSQKAELIRSEASFTIAKANLEKIKESSGDNVDLIKSSIRQSFTSADDAIRNRVDQFIDDSDSRFPSLKFNFGDYFKKVEIEDDRYEIEKVLDEWRSEIDNLNNLDSTDDLQEIILISQHRIKKIENFLADLAFALSSAGVTSSVTQSDLNKYSSDVSVARSTLSSSLSSLISSYNNLSSSVDFGSKGQDVLISEANVEQARAGVLLSQSNLEKTIIRSPITGKINSINIKKGSFVSAFQDVVEVVGGSNIEIKTFITESEIDRLKVGTSVLIDREYEGEIYKIAPSINSSTQKIEVIVIPKQSVSLKNGQSVSLSVSIDREEISYENILIPIKSLKINSDGNFVLSVDSNSKIFFKKVEVGEIIGESIVVDSGLNIDDVIVIDARGLKEGQVINLD